MDLHLAGKTAIVTGGDSNIGRAVTLTFAEEGCNVVIANRNVAQGQKVAALANSISNKLGGKCIAITTDITNNDQVMALVQKTLQEFKQIDILVNNAGWNLGSEFSKISRELMEKIIAINLWGHINTMKAVLPHMIERKSGVIISVGSDSGRVGESGSAIYAACKGGVIALIKTVAKENGRHGIRANMVCPGLTLPGDPPGFYKAGSEEISDTSMWATPWFTPEKIKQLTSTVYPLGKLGSPQDLANAIVFLASDRAGDITGQTLSVSGGYVMI
jgi:2-hydroxycyclohexanecarboxyl-CoA dehydrogenase